MIEYVLALIMCASIGCLAYSIGLVEKNLQEVRNVLQKIREEIRYGCTLYEKYNEKTENKQIEYVPYPLTLNTPQPDDWKYPYVTWTKDDTLSNINTSDTYKTPVRDVMTGKKVIDEST